VVHRPGWAPSPEWRLWVVTSDHSPRVDLEESKKNERIYGGSTVNLLKMYSNDVTIPTTFWTRGCPCGQFPFPTARLCNRIYISNTPTVSRLGLVDGHQQTLKVFQFFLVCCEWLVRLLSLLHIKSCLVRGVRSFRFVFFVLVCLSIESVEDWMIPHVCERSDRFCFLWRSDLRLGMLRA
jgi:hypothetical protein